VTITGRRPTAGDYVHDLSAFAYRRSTSGRGGDRRARRRPGTPDVLVNNAGANFARQPSEWDPAVFESRSGSTSSAFRLASASRSSRERFRRRRRC
jgi:hypothetical protein